MQNPEVIEKRKNTCMEKFGTKYAINDPKVREKAINVMRNKNITEKKEIIAKKKNTTIKKYGKKVFYSFL